MKNRNSIDEQTWKYLICTDIEPARLYLMPKIHKPSYPGRPIVASNGTPTEKISHFVDYHLFSLGRTNPVFSKGHNTFSPETEQNYFTPSSFPLSYSGCIFTLYKYSPWWWNPCMPVGTTFEKCAGTTHTWPNNTNIMYLNKGQFRLCKKTLPSDQWNCHGHLYDSSYANLLMAKLEESFLSTVTTLKPYVWWRYIDDIFVIWQHGEESLKTIHKRPQLMASMQSSSLLSGHPIPSHSWTHLSSYRMDHFQWTSTPNPLTHTSTYQQTAAIHTTASHQYHSVKPWESVASAQQRTVSSNIQIDSNNTLYRGVTQDPSYQGR